MNQKIKQNLVKGFLKTKGTTIVNGNDEEIILTGWGLGNWLLCEGYMWLSHNTRFDRPRRIEAVIRELTGSDYEKNFWKQFRANYITKADIFAMAKLGYNSVRIPFNWRVLMEDEPGITFKEDGFQLLDKVLSWCEESQIYAFLDMHGAPGGQTGANIDDSIDDIPRLFIDDDSWDKAIALWKEIASRYHNRYIVGGYDLLNEPIRPSNNGGDYDYLVPKLKNFYSEVITEIRKIDKNHLFTIEGHHWATNMEIFDQKYDDNMVIHFHRYACYPDQSAFLEWIKLSKKLNIPLWLGETGENLTEWFAALYPLSVSLGIGYNLWPWKKMNCHNSPLSIPTPANWELLIDYTKGKKRPSYQEAQTILNEYLENMKIENCVSNDLVTNSVFRSPPFKVLAVDFDELPGRGVSYSGSNLSNNLTYRANTMMNILEDKNYQMQKRFFFDCMWDRFYLNLSTNEFASYQANHLNTNNTVAFTYHCECEVMVSLYQNEIHLASLKLFPTAVNQRSEKIPLLNGEYNTLKIRVDDGSLNLINFHFE